MKIKNVLFFLSFILCVSMSFAQTPAKTNVKMDANLVVVFPAGTNFATPINVDISAVKFKNDALMSQFVNSCMRTNLVNARLNADKTITLSLYNDTYTASWTHVEWNKALADLANQYRTCMNTVSGN